MATDFKKLDEVIAKIGAVETSQPLQSLGERERQEIIIDLIDGVTVRAEDYDNIETVNGMLSYGGEHCFLYIDHPKERGLDTRMMLETIPCTDGPKFHLTKCTTLERMHRDGRSDRYILIQNPNGDFPCYPHNEDLKFYDYKINAKLIPCRHCLDAVGYMNFSIKDWSPEKKEEFANNFNIKKFLDHQSPFFFEQRFYNAHPHHGRNNRNPNAPKTRENLISRRGTKCQNQECSIDLKDKTELLHMHHINGISGDDRDSNLVLLCALCHAQQPLHQGMERFIENKNIRLILRLRERTSN